MAGELGHAGFASRAPQPGDPVVCGACGLTIGTRGGLESPEARASAEAAHDPDCRKRIAHMQQHRTAEPCPRCVPS